MNTLYYGDNLKILRDYIRVESVNQSPMGPQDHSGSPPSKGGVTEGRGGCAIVGVVRDSNRSDNVLFKNESGTEADSR